MTKLTDEGHRIIQATRHANLLYKFRKNYFTQKALDILKDFSLN